MTNKELLQAARDACRHSYSPYSHFAVGCALITNQNQLYTGCNIENASYGATMCAERVAIFKCISEGHLDIDKIAVVSENGSYAYPCGMCRQVMWEFMPDGSVVLEDDTEGIKEITVKELLPDAFLLEKHE